MGDGDALLLFLGPSSKIKRKTYLTEYSHGHGMLPNYEQKFIFISTYLSTLTYYTIIIKCYIILDIEAK